MMHLYDRATMAHALTTDIEPELHSLLQSHFSRLGELIDYTEFLVIQPGDTEADLLGLIGQTPTVEPIEGCRYGEPGFFEHWTSLVKSGGWYEMTLTFGAEFAYVLLIQNAPGVPSDLLRLCGAFVETAAASP